MSVKGRLAVALSAMLSVYALQAGAACNDRADPLVSPVDGVVLKFNDGATGRVRLQGEQVQDDGRLRLPSLVPGVAELPAGKFAPTTGQVVYLESDGRRASASVAWNNGKAGSTGPWSGSRLMAVRVCAGTTMARCAR